MASRKRISILVSILLLSIIAIPVLGNDAGTGGDAGNNTSSATSLPATNGTYYGNLTATTDNSDYYLINMSSNTGIAVQITYPSSTDFDLALLNSGGGYIDLSTSSGTTDDVTSNGTSVGGSSVYIWVDRYSGSGQYTMQIWIFSTGSSGGGGAGSGNGHDAGSGTDAGNNIASAMTLNTTNMSYWGDVTYTTDPNDYYKVSMPANFGVTATLTWNSTVDLDLEVYDNSSSMIVYSWFSNPETVTVNNYGGSNLFFRVYAYGTNTGTHDYNLSFTFEDLTNAPVNNQNDAGTGGDASNDYLNPTVVNISSVAVNNTFIGWGSLDDDLNDNYQTNVPMGHGIRVTVWFNSSVSDFQVILGDDQANTIDYSGVNNPESVTSNGSGTYPGMIVEGMDILLQVRATSGEGNYGMSWWFFTLDADGDGYYDTVEEDCGSDPEDNYSVPLDTDSDGICDTLDSDDDGDYVEDVNDTFPLDASEWEDTDNDNVGNNADLDDDGDGFSDANEIECGSDPLDGWNHPPDFDSDGICDLQDSDDDNDGYFDDDDAFPQDDSEWADTDNNGVGDNSDTDDDGDGYSDNIETSCDSDPLNSFDVPSDIDMDGTCDLMDSDMDGDNYPNENDAFPTDSQEWLDTDNDGFGNNVDIDDDGDSVSDNYDSFPLDSNEWADNDNDGLGDNGDLDDDNDGWSDLDETSCSTNPLSSQSIPSDFDNDMVCDLVDSDDDGDGVLDEDDVFPRDNSEWEDTDSDGIGNNFDDDDDGDNWYDIFEPNCGTDPLDGNSIPLDFDEDWVCDLVDDDDDNDGVTDVDDPFPKNPLESVDTDSDGIGNNADNDDDGDGWTDNSEALCFTSSLSSNSVPDDMDGDKTCDQNDPDIDGDNIINEQDAFPMDSSEWVDRNNDGRGDNAYPLSIIDKMSLNPIPTILISFTIIALIGGVVLVYTNQQKSSKNDILKGTDMTSYMENDLATNEEINDFEENSDFVAVNEVIPDPTFTIISDSEDSIEDEKQFDTESKGIKIPPPPPGFTPEMRSIPPPPPGFEPAPINPESNMVVASWEDLPPGGEYTETDPLRYTGVGIGMWVEKEDESWERISK
jgi:hypothetical protein